ncbi:hypothetical protein [Mycobacterium angelicum]|uniref:DUF4267 domain-containing protein n=1 Tax=Mycobacterium angelicum TaxID=470074 RepID=A0A1W9ZWE4_MYCAN|nr:hypothetical protein [Mycobacterium angelicum]MCV7199659.1 hypothetical protein [Mycobacterium angelicum]ORA22120.1 hypothetical protein BST12_09945 [Mycobacterium angelicum]
MKLRRIEILRAAWGAVLLFAPSAVLSALHGVQADRKALVVTRILGARHLVQAWVSGINPSRGMLAAGAVVDAIHSLTAFGLGILDRRRLQGGVADGIVAAVWAGFGWHQARAEITQPDTSRDRRA